MEPLRIPGIENGYRVDDLIWRGAQPEDTAWPLLAEAGCRVVIDLNNVRADVQKQYAMVSACGMEYVSCAWDGIIPPNEVAIHNTLAFMDRQVSLKNIPIFIHCRHGSDRTGTLCACWRIHHDKYDFDAAMEEAFASLGLQGMHEFWMAAAVAEFAIGPKST